MEDREAWCAAVRGAAKSQTQLTNWTTTISLIVVGSIPDPEGVDCSSVGRTKWRHMEFGNSIPRKQVCTGLAFYTVFPRQFESIPSFPPRLWSWLSPLKKKDISSQLTYHIVQQLMPFRGEGCHCLAEIWQFSSYFSLQWFGKSLEKFYGCFVNIHPCLAKSFGRKKKNLNPTIGVWHHKFSIISWALSWKK